jgi:hypothetical protein
MSASDASRRLTAHHESGHAAAALELDLPVYAISIERAAGAHGRVIMPVPNVDTTDLLELTPESIEFFEHHILTLFAGPIAQRQFSRSRWQRDGAEDFRRAAALLDCLQVDTRCRRLHWCLLWRRAELLIERYWPVISELAVVLLEVNRLEGTELLEVFRGACAAAPPLPCRLAGTPDAELMRLLTRSQRASFAQADDLTDPASGSAHPDRSRDHP